MLQFHSPQWRLRLHPTHVRHNPASQIVEATRSHDGLAFLLGNANIGNAHNGLNQIVSTGGLSVTHDNRGNTIAIGAASYGYSSENMMVSAPNGVTLAYDPLLRLHEVADWSGAERFLYDGLALIAEYDGSNQLLRRYVHGPGMDEPLVWYEGTDTSDRRWLLADERGSIIAVTNGAGAATAGNVYDEFGRPGSNNAGRFQYTGQKWISEIGLYDYKARMYNPSSVGGPRFMQTDPIGYAGGMNLYAYVGGDPVNFVDPLGMRVSRHGRSICRSGSGCRVNGIDQDIAKRAAAEKME